MLGVNLRKMAERRAGAQLIKSTMSSRGIFSRQMPGTLGLGKLQSCRRCNSHRHTSSRWLYTNMRLLGAKPGTTKLKYPVDDVYLEDLYEPKQYDLEGAITTLKRYTELDYTSPDTLLHLLLNLHLRPMKRGRLQAIIKTIELPHEFGHENRICVFTDSEEVIKLALDNGAHLAGGDSIIQQTVVAKKYCDGYLCTPEYFKSTVMGHQELTRTLKTLMPTKRRGVTSDILPDLLTLKDDTIVSNRSGEPTRCKIIVGRIKQPTNELISNIEAGIAAVRSEQNPKHPPIIEGASLLCCQETLPFHLEEADVD